MPTLLVSPFVLKTYATEIRAAFPGVDPIVLPADPAARLGEDDCARIDYAFFSLDMVPALSRSFFDAIQAAPNLKWIHVMSAGVDHPAFQRLIARGVRMSTSAGATSRPIAQALIGGMLILSRGFLHWREAQARREWAPLRAEDNPEDLFGQRMTVVGLGAIGAETARIARAIGLEVTGVRRSPWRQGDPVETIVPPAKLLELAATTQWLALACPLTDETRGLCSREVLAALPKGAFVMNIARGEVADEAALIDALESGHLGGAYLDVFSREPLSPDSPLWAMPNVIVSPHNSNASRGNEPRVAREYFLPNLARMAKGEPLINEVT